MNATRRADAIDLAALAAHLERRSTRLSEDAARWLGHHLARRLAEAHGHVDEEGDPTPIVHGDVRPERVRIDTDGEVALDAGEEGGASAPELSGGGRPTPRADVYALGVMLRSLLAAPDDPELEAALATATEPVLLRRRITCVELEALLARGADLEAGRRALAEAARMALDDLRHARPPSVPISPSARVGVALVTAAAVFAAGVAIVERWPR